MKKLCCSHTLAASALAFATFATPIQSNAAKITLDESESLKIYRSILNGAHEESDVNDNYKVLSARITGEFLTCDRTYTDRGIKTKCGITARDGRGLRRFSLRPRQAQILNKTLDRNPNIPKVTSNSTRTTSITLKSLKCDRKPKTKALKPICTAELAE